MKVIMKVIAHIQQSTLSLRRHARQDRRRPRILSDERDPGQIANLTETEPMLPGLDCPVDILDLTRPR